MGRVKRATSMNAQKKVRMGIIWLEAGIRRGLRDEGAPYVWGRRRISTHC
jgi:hypothetical protein